METNYEKWDIESIIFYLIIGLIFVGCVGVIGYIGYIIYKLFTNTNNDDNKTTHPHIV